MDIQRIRPRRYDGISRGAKRAVLALALFLVAAAFAPPAEAQNAAPVKIVVLGDSLSAGFGLGAGEAFPERLGAALARKGIAATVVNAGVSGDTASGGLGRLDWSVPEGTDAVILELGANDALRGVEPAITRKAIGAIMSRLAARKIAILLCGMYAPPNMGAEYTRAFNDIFPSLASTHGAVFYPFFLEGVAADAKFNLRDGLHPNPQGVERIVERIMPKVEELVARVRAARGS